MVSVMRPAACCAQMIPESKVSAEGVASGLVSGDSEETARALQYCDEEREEKDVLCACWPSDRKLEVEMARSACYRCIN